METNERVILRESEVINAGYATSRSAMRRQIASGTFPPPIRLGPKSIGWRRTELDAWLANQPSLTPGASADGHRDT